MHIGIQTIMESLITPDFRLKSVLVSLMKYRSVVIRHRRNGEYCNLQIWATMRLSGDSLETYYMQHRYVDNTETLYLKYKIRIKYHWEKKHETIK